MLKLITNLFCIALAFCVSASAQITISNNFMPAYGTQNSYINDIFVSAAHFDMLKSGSGGPTNWDFSSRSYSGDFTEYFVDPATTPRADSFPTANIAAMSLVVGSPNDTAWQMYLSTASEYTRLGTVAHVGGNETVNSFNNYTPDWVFPIAYNNQWTSYRHWESYSSSSYSYTFDTADYHADAWGTATYKSNTVQCLRVVTTRRTTTNVYLNSNDSLIFSSVQLTQNVSFYDEDFNFLVGVNKVSFMGIDSYTGNANSEFLDMSTDVERDEHSPLPLTFRLSQNFPNPFNPSTRIPFNLASRSTVKISVYDVLGREVKTLVDGEFAAGRYTVDWDGNDHTGGAVASGIYFTKMTANSASFSRKMMLLK